ncbi:MAG: YvcK family protein, partial [Candidatus Spechtbacteria bacterium]|nr:YvcK family protein [Candidatus Spechtbacteria bacterium]
VGPGNLFSSILPNLLVRGVSYAIRRSKAKKIYIANLFTQPGHTDHFTVLEFVRVLASYIGEDVFDHIIYNNRFPDSFSNAGANASVGAPVASGVFAKKDKRFIGRSVASSLIRRTSASDPIARIRNPFLHDPLKLGKVIWEVARL